VSVALSVYPVPALSIERAAYVATPWETVTWPPPDSVPPAGFDPKASVTFVVLSPVTTLPDASSTATVTVGRLAPAVDPAGCDVKASLVPEAVATVTFVTAPVVDQECQTAVTA
jgi:hypothetical protein